eukprot:COSAG02_NODE_1566_length_11907_cov_8.008299_5_plen_48_part_00
MAGLEIDVARAVTGASNRYVQGDDAKKQELEEAWHKAGVKLATKGPF